MEPQKSMVWPIVLSILGSAVVFGGSGYYLANIKNSPITSTVTSTYTTRTTVTTQPSIATIAVNSDTPVAKTSYTNTKYKYSFEYPSTFEAKGTQGDAHLLPLTATVYGVYVIPPNSSTKEGSFENLTGRPIFSITLQGKDFSEAAVKSMFRPDETITVTSTTLGGANAYKATVQSSPSGGTTTNTYYSVKTSTNDVMWLTVPNNNSDSTVILNSFTLTK